jgi:hypothetical protein
METVEEGAVEIREVEDLVEEAADGTPVVEVQAHQEDLEETVEGGGWYPSGGGSGPPGGPPPTPGTGFYDPNARKPTFVCKPDLKAYTELKSAESYGKWIEDTVCVLRAQGLGMFLDPNFVPGIQDSVEWDAKKSFVYMMLLNNVKTLTGMRIVKNHRSTYDAQAFLAELADEHMRSTYAVISGRELLTRITTRCFNPRGENSLRWNSSPNLRT